MLVTCNVGQELAARLAHARSILESAARSLDAPPSAPPARPSDASGSPYNLDLQRFALLDLERDED
jgi:hypothetical protein